MASSSIAAQGAAVELPGGMLLARAQEFRRPQQAADMLGAEGRLGSLWFMDRHPCMHDTSRYARIAQRETARQGSACRIAFPHRFPGNCRPQSKRSTAAAIARSRVGVRPGRNDEQGGTCLHRVAADPPAIVAEGASKLFLDGAVVAFHQLSLAVKRNEIMCVVGPSGCGKTTLLRCIAGLTDLSERQAPGPRRAGRRPPARRRRHGVPAFRPAAVEDRASTTPPSGSPWRACRAREIQERVTHYLELVGLTGFERHYPYQLSGGMQQRVGLVRALAMNPSILLMDEPFAALDAQTREILQEELLPLMERPDERKTMVFITHSIDEAILLGDRIAVMSARPGRIKEVLDMPFGWPRNADAVRSDPRFTELRLHIWHQLAHRQAAERASAEGGCVTTIEQARGDSLDPTRERPFRRPGARGARRRPSAGIAGS